MQDVALVDVQLSIEIPPGETVVGLAVNVTVGAGVTETVADAGALVPPAPLQVNAYTVVADTAPVLCEPLLGRVPLQAPLAVQDVALVDVQLRTDAPPAATMAGLALSVIVGGTGGAATATDTVAVGLVPPGPVQVSEYEVVVDRGAVAWVPLEANGPAQPLEAVHAVASVDVQVNVDIPPMETDIGLALSVAVGAGVEVGAGGGELEGGGAGTGVAAGLTVTWTTEVVVMPPVPTQVKVNSVSAVSAPVLCEPTVATGPLHPPDAEQEAALVELHVSAEACPVLTDEGAALIEAVGAGTGVATPPLTPLPPHPTKVIATAVPAAASLHRIVLTTETP